MFSGGKAAEIRRWWRRSPQHGREPRSGVWPSVQLLGRMSGDSARRPSSTRAKPWLLHPLPALVTADRGERLLDGRRHERGVAADIDDAALLDALPCPITALGGAQIRGRLFINGSFGDPAALIETPFGRRAVLLPVRRILKIGREGQRTRQRSARIDRTIQDCERRDPGGRWLNS